MEQTRDPRNNPHFYGQLIYDKSKIQLGRDHLFNKLYWKTGELHAKLSNWTII